MTSELLTNLFHIESPAHVYWKQWRFIPRPAPTVTPSRPPASPAAPSAPHWQRPRDAHDPQQTPRSTPRAAPAAAASAEEAEGGAGRWRSGERDGGGEGVGGTLAAVRAAVRWQQRWRAKGMMAVCCWGEARGAAGAQWEPRVWVFCSNPAFSCRPRPPTRHRHHQRTRGRAGRGLGVRAGATAERKGGGGSSVGGSVRRLGEAVASEGAWGGEGLAMKPTLAAWGYWAADGGCASFRFHTPPTRLRPTHRVAAVWRGRAARAFEAAGYVEFDGVFVKPTSTHSQASHAAAIACEVRVRPSAFGLLLHTHLSTRSLRALTPEDFTQQRPHGSALPVLLGPAAWPALAHRPSPPRLVRFLRRWRVEQHLRHLRHSQGREGRGGPRARTVRVKQGRSAVGVRVQRGKGRKGGKGVQVAKGKGKSGGKRGAVCEGGGARADATVEEAAKKGGMGRKGKAAGRVIEGEVRTNKAGEAGTRKRRGEAVRSRKEVVVERRGRRKVGQGLDKKVAGADGARGRSTPKRKQGGSGVKVQHTLKWQKLLSPHRPAARLPPAVSAALQPPLPPAAGPPTYVEVELSVPVVGRQGATRGRTRGSEGKGKGGGEGGSGGGSEAVLRVRMLVDARLAMLPLFPPPPVHLLSSRIRHLLHAHQPSLLPSTISPPPHAGHPRPSILPTINPASVPPLSPTSPFQPPPASIPASQSPSPPLSSLPPSPPFALPHRLALAAPLSFLRLLPRGGGGEQDRGGEGGRSGKSMGTWQVVAVGRGEAEGADDGRDGDRGELTLARGEEDGQRSKRARVAALGALDGMREPDLFWSHPLNAWFMGQGGGAGKGGGEGAGEGLGAVALGVQQLAAVLDAVDGEVVAGMRAQGGVGALLREEDGDEEWLGELPGPPAPAPHTATHLTAQRASHAHAHNGTASASRASLASRAGRRARAIRLEQRVQNEAEVLLPPAFTAATGGARAHAHSSTGSQAWRLSGDAMVGAGPANGKTVGGGVREVKIEGEPAGAGSAAATGAQSRLYRSCVPVFARRVLLSPESLGAPPPSSHHPHLPSASTAAVHPLDAQHASSTPSAAMGTSSSTSAQQRYVYSEIPPPATSLPALVPPRPPHDASATTPSCPATPPLSDHPLHRGPVLPLPAAAAPAAAVAPTPDGRGSGSSTSLAATSAGVAAAGAGAGGAEKRDDKAGKSAREQCEERESKVRAVDGVKQGRRAETALKAGSRARGKVTGGKAGERKEGRRQKEKGKGKGLVKGSRAEVRGEGEKGKGMLVRWRVKGDTGQHKGERVSGRAVGGGAVRLKRKAASTGRARQRRRQRVARHWLVGAEVSVGGSGRESREEWEVVPVLGLREEMAMIKLLLSHPHAHATAQEDVCVCSHAMEAAGSRSQLQGGSVPQAATSIDHGAATGGVAGGVAGGGAAADAVPAPDRPAIPLSTYGTTAAEAHEAQEAVDAVHRPGATPASPPAVPCAVVRQAEALRDPSLDAALLAAAHSKCPWCARCSPSPPAASSSPRHQQHHATWAGTHSGLSLLALCGDAGVAGGGGGSSSAGQRILASLQGTLPSPLTAALLCGEIKSLLRSAFGSRRLTGPLSLPAIAAATRPSPATPSPSPAPLTTSKPPPPVPDATPAAAGAAARAGEEAGEEKDGGSGGREKGELKERLAEGQRRNGRGGSGGEEAEGSEEAGSGVRSVVALCPPAVLVGYQDDWLATSPSLLRLWDKAPLEPYCLPKPLSVLAICPALPAIARPLRSFLSDLAAVYEACSLGTFSPLLPLSPAADHHHPPGMLPVPLPPVHVPPACAVHAFSDSLASALSRLPSAALFPPTNSTDPDLCPSTLLVLVCPWPSPGAALSLFLRTAAHTHALTLAAAKESSASTSPRASHPTAPPTPAHAPRPLTVHLLPLEHVLSLSHAARASSLRQLALSLFSKVRRSPLPLPHCPAQIGGELAAAEAGESVHGMGEARRGGGAGAIGVRGGIMDRLGRQPQQSPTAAAVAGGSGTAAAGAAAESSGSGAARVDGASTPGSAFMPAHPPASSAPPLPPATPCLLHEPPFILASPGSACRSLSLPCTSSPHPGDGEHTAAKGGQGQAGGSGVTHKGEQQGRNDGKAGWQREKVSCQPSLSPSLTAAATPGGMAALQAGARMGAAAGGGAGVAGAAPPSTGGAGGVVLDGKAPLSLHCVYMWGHDGAPGLDAEAAAPWVVAVWTDSRGELLEQGWQLRGIAVTRAHREPQGQQQEQPQEWQKQQQQQQQKQQQQGQQQQGQQQQGQQQQGQQHLGSGCLHLRLLLPQAVRLAMAAVAEAQASRDADKGQGEAGRERQGGGDSGEEDWWMAPRPVYVVKAGQGMARGELQAWEQAIASLSSSSFRPVFSASPCHAPHPAARHPTPTKGMSCAAAGGAAGRQAGRGSEGGGQAAGAGGGEERREGSPGVKVPPLERMPWQPPLEPASASLPPHVRGHETDQVDGRLPGQAGSSAYHTPTPGSLAHATPLAATAPPHLPALRTGTQEERLERHGVDAGEEGMGMGEGVEGCVGGDGGRGGGGGEGVPRVWQGIASVTIAWLHVVPHLQLMSILQTHPLTPSPLSTPVLPISSPSRSPSILPLAPPALSPMHPHTSCATPLPSSLASRLTATTPTAVPPLEPFSPPLAPLPPSSRAASSPISAHPATLSHSLFLPRLPHERAHPPHPPLPSAPLHGAVGTRGAWQSSQQHRAGATLLLVPHAPWIDLSTPTHSPCNPPFFPPTPLHHLHLPSRLPLALAPRQPPRRQRRLPLLLPPPPPPPSPCPPLPVPLHPLAPAHVTQLLLQRLTRQQEEERKKRKAGKPMGKGKGRTKARVVSVGVRGKTGSRGTGSKGKGGKKTGRAGKGEAAKGDSRAESEAGGSKAREETVEKQEGERQKGKAKKAERMSKERGVRGVKDVEGQEKDKGMSSRKVQGGRKKKSVTIGKKTSGASGKETGVAGGKAKQRSGGSKEGNVVKAVRRNGKQGKGREAGRSSGAASGAHREAGRANGSGRGGRRGPGREGWRVWRERMREVGRMVRELTSGQEDGREGVRGVATAVILSTATHRGCVGGDGSTAAAAGSAAWWLGLEGLSMGAAQEAFRLGVPWQGAHQPPATTSGLFTRSPLAAAAAGSPGGGLGARLGSHSAAHAGIAALGSAAAVGSYPFPVPAAAAGSGVMAGGIGCGAGGGVVAVTVAAHFTAATVAAVAQRRERETEGKLEGRDAPVESSKGPRVVGRGAAARHRAGDAVRDGARNEGGAGGDVGVKRGREGEGSGAGGTEEGSVWSSRKRQRVGSTGGGAGKGGEGEGVQGGGESDVEGGREGGVECKGAEIDARGRGSSDGTAHAEHREAQAGDGGETREGAQHSHGRGAGSEGGRQGEERRQRVKGSVGAEKRGGEVGGSDSEWCEVAADGAARRVAQQLGAELHALTWLSASPASPSPLSHLPFHCLVAARLLLLLQHWPSASPTGQPSGAVRAVGDGGMGGGEGVEAQGGEQAAHVPTHSQDACF
ncbi:hypothetical protein CLOM_g18618 [Closterium sp. NIES-68]|nr:hypothetical protein CLOM_g18618 [Closterium sp. NIES-68]